MDMKKERKKEVCGGWSTILGDGSNTFQSTPLDNCFHYLPYSNTRYSLRKGIEKHLHSGGRFQLPFVERSERNLTLLLSPSLTRKPTWKYNKLFAVLSFQSFAAGSRSLVTSELAAVSRKCLRPSRKSMASVKEIGNFDKYGMLQFVNKSRRHTKDHGTTKRKNPETTRNENV